MSWGLPEALGRSHGLEMLRGQGEQAGRKGSKLEVRGVSWGLPKAPGKFQGPRDAQGARGVSWCHKYTAPCIYGSMRIQLHAYMAPCIYGSMRIRHHAYMVPRIYSTSCIQHCAYMAPRVYGAGGAKGSERATW